MHPNLNSNPRKFKIPFIYLCRRLKTQCLSLIRPLSACPSWHCWHRLCSGLHALPWHCCRTHFPHGNTGCSIWGSQLFNCLFSYPSGLSLMISYQVDNSWLKTWVKTDHRFSKHGLKISNISISWELVRDANSQVSSQSNWTRQCKGVD